MDRNLIVAASVAAALHGGVLFGFNRGPVPKPVAPTKENVPAMQITIPPEPPEETEIVVVDAAQPKGSPEPAPARSIDTPSVTPGPFTTQISPELPSVEIAKVGVINNLPPGRIDGTGEFANAIALLGDLDNPPRTRTQIAPQYPYEAKASGRTGEVFVEFTVDEHGRVVNPSVVRSTDRAFEEPTLRAVSKWRFEPGRVHGKVVRFRMAVPVHFNLESA